MNKVLATVPKYTRDRSAQLRHTLDPHAEFMTSSTQMKEAEARDVMRSPCILCTTLLVMISRLRAQPDGWVRARARE